MVERIATKFLNETNLRQLQETNVRINASSEKISTGFKGSRLQDFSENANVLLDTYNLQGQTQIYMNNIQTAQSRLQATEQNLQSMVDLIGEASSLWTTGRSERSAETRAALAPQAQNLVESFYSVFNTKFDNRFIFGGTAGDRQPLDSNPVASPVPSSPAPSTFYNGDSALPVTMTAPNQTSSYGVAGNEQAFAEMKAGLEALWYGLENNDTNEIENSINALQDAQQQLTGLLGDVGGQISEMEKLDGRHESTMTFLKEKADDIDKADVTEALTEFQQQTTVLEASMSVMTTISRLTLLDFIR